MITEKEFKKTCIFQYFEKKKVTIESMMPGVYYQTERGVYGDVCCEFLKISGREDRICLPRICPIAKFFELDRIISKFSKEGKIEKEEDKSEVKPDAKKTD